jgi:predicted Zn-ribbon and HTH transcriptional regulator
VFWIRIGHAPDIRLIQILSSLKNLSKREEKRFLVTSVADPECFFPDSDPTIAPSRILGVKKHQIPDPTYFCIKAINKFCLLIPDPIIAPSRIRGVKKHRIPDPDPQHC